MDGNQRGGRRMTTMMFTDYEGLRIALGVLILATGFFGVFCTSVALANWRTPGTFRWLLLGISVMYFAALCFSVYFFEVA